MTKILAFDSVTLDGYFAGPNGETDWFKSIRKDEEFDKDAHERASAEGTLLFGRTTYEMMKSYWPTPEAVRDDPGMARVMNDSDKIVFSRTLNGEEEERTWKKVKVVPELTHEAVNDLKNDGKDMTILGSGSVVQQLMGWGLVDEYRLNVVPVVLGAGKGLFSDVKSTNLKLLGEKSYRNGIVALRYGAV